MALYQTALRMSHDMAGTTRRKWSNVFFFDAPNAEAAAAAGIGLWSGYLRAAAAFDIFCYEVYATSLAALDEDYAVQTMTVGLERGQLPLGAGEPYDFTVCASVTIRASSGRPSRKFWRPGFREGDIVGGQTINSSLVTAIEAAFNDALLNTPLVDPDGQALQAPVVVRYSRRKLGRESAENLPSPPAVG